jgi:hypothetical protein
MIPPVSFRITGMMFASPARRSSSSTGINVPYEVTAYPEAALVFGASRPPWVTLLPASVFAPA